MAAAYTNHCVRYKRSSDWTAFDNIARAVGGEAYEILEGLRDNYTVDFEHVAGTEIEFYLDKNFQPCDEDEAAYSGRIDIGLLMDDQGGIDDWKSHMRPFDAPDEQSDLYSLAWFQLNPQLQSLLFRFRFVRYAHCERTAEYTRADLDRIMSVMEHHRAKQLAIHADPASAEAIPSRQCLYCPLLNSGCPIDPAVNSWAQGTPQDWVKRAVYIAYANAQNNERLKEYVQASGMPLEYVDGKGDRYLFGPKAVESQEFPLLPVFEKLMDWRSTGTDDIGWMDNLRVSSTKLKGYLKAKKRATLDGAVRDIAIPVTRVQTKLHKPQDEKDTDEYAPE